MAEQRDVQPEPDPREALYTGPGTLAGRYLRSFWQPIHPSKGVTPGRVRPIRVLGEDLTLYRGENGQPHLVDYRCAHRGTQLSAGAVEGDSIRCYYHGWKYDAAGQCIEQPGEPRPFCDKIRIRSYPVRDYLGIVFAYLGEGEPPEFTRYERFEEKAQSLRVSVEIAPFNYYQRMENSHDFVHLPFVHKQAYPPVKLRTLDNVVPRIKTEECAWGMKTHRMDPNGLEVVAYFGMPNINYIIRGGGTSREWESEGELLFARVPVDDSSHLQFTLGWNAPADETGTDRAEIELINSKRNETVRAVLDGRMTIDEVIAAGTPGLFSIEDDVAMLGQGTLWQRQSENLGQSDIAVALMRRLWARDLRALNEGRARKNWRRTPDMVPGVAALPRDLNGTIRD